MQGGGAGDLMELLPPGFRFHPTDEEIITQYLARKAADSRFTAIAIAEVDMNKCEPWDLPKKLFKGGEKENYFFCQRDRKYPTGMRTNRATGSGYWKATGKDKEIYKPRNCLVGMKKTLVFYKGRAPKGEKTNWVMHEYRLEGGYCYYNFPRGAKDEWVVCRVFHKNTSSIIGSSSSSRSPMFGGIHDDGSFLNQFVVDVDDDPCLPPLVDLNAASCSTKVEEGLFVENNNNNYDYNYYNNSNNNVNNAFPEASCSSQSYPFSGFKATPTTISGISNQDCDLDAISADDPLWEYY